MSNETLQSLFHYKRWADGELLDAIATLDAQQYGEAHHTCLRIFNHIHVVDAIFKANLLGERHGFTATNTPETPTLTALRSAVTELDNWLVDYVGALSPQEGATPLSFCFVDGDPRRNAAPSGDSWRLSQGRHRADSGAVRHHAAARYPDHLFASQRAGAAQPLIPAPAATTAHRFMEIEKRKEVETSFLLACAAACDSVYLAHFDGKAGRQLGKLESVASRGIRVLQRILRRVDPGVVFAKA